ncbi:hypothetical protein [Pseudomonas sp. F(2018)]|uniref:hypothetical protein n=1 Tax=Pseudomonas sp. F(2018) TaxID=2502240 RepID=UPI0010F76CCE|nr:hypothetical protein [Pseudomonas sp. F(2018)]
MRAWVRTLGRWLHRVVLLNCWALLCLYLMFKLFERSHFIDALPAAIEPGGVVLISGESGFREGCGVAVFRLSGETRDALNNSGLAALGEARQARGYADDYYHFEAWQSTPVLAGEISEGWPPLACADADEDLERRILLAMQSPGSFHARKHEALLLVLPAEGLIVFGYFG